jgi:hypothetical protein
MPSTSTKRELPDALKEWNKEVARVRKADPSLSFKEALQVASKLRKEGKSPSKKKAKKPRSGSSKSPIKKKAKTSQSGSSKSPAKKKARLA